MKVPLKLILSKQKNQNLRSRPFYVYSCLGSLLPDERPTDRTQRALELWKLLEDKKVALDVSHYNALLRIHVENEHNVSPTDFLSWMEGKGIAPNRVTFQVAVITLKMECFHMW